MVSNKSSRMPSIASEGYEDDSSVSILVKTFSPLPSTLSLRLPGTSTPSSVISAVLQKASIRHAVVDKLRLTKIGGQSIERDATVSSLASSQLNSGISPLISLELRMPIMGGKGGFGSMLRAQGGKMSSNRNGEENNDSCRDLNGRRLSTVKQARQLALYLGNQAERDKEISEAQKNKYAKLEKMLGRKPKDESDFVEAAQKLHESGEDLEDGEEGEKDHSEGSSTNHFKSAMIFEAGNEYKGKKRDRIDDTQYIEQSREIVDNVRSAVASAMMKKKKKARATSSNVATKTKSPAQQQSAQVVL